MANQKQMDFKEEIEDRLIALVGLLGGWLAENAFLWISIEIQRKLASYQKKDEIHMEIENVWLSSLVGWVVCWLTIISFCEVHRSSEKAEMNVS